MFWTTITEKQPNQDQINPHVCSHRFPFRFSSEIVLVAPTLRLEYRAHCLFESLSAFVHSKGFRGLDEPRGLRRIVRLALRPSLSSLSAFASHIQIEAV
jgi:hypothetical protein